MRPVRVPAAPITSSSTRTGFLIAHESQRPHPRLSAAVEYMPWRVWIDQDVITYTEPWDAAEYLTTKQDVTAYLNAALAENDPQLVTAALGDIARSKGLPQAAADSGQDRESL